VPETEGSFNESETSEDSSKKGPTKDEQRHFLLKVLLPKVKWHKLNWKVANEAEWECVTFGAHGYIKSLDLPNCGIALDGKKLKPLFTQHLQVRHVLKDRGCVASWMRRFVSASCATPANT